MFYIIHYYGLYDIEAILNTLWSPGIVRIQPIFYFPDGSDGKAPVYNAGDPGSIPGSGRSPGEGNGNPLQYSCLENPVGGEAS